MASTGTALFPGASTFPNTNVYPGQGTLPLLRVLVSFDDVSDATPTWNDLSSRVRSCTVDRGRNSELEDFDAGNASIVLDNRDRQLDPNSSTFSYGIGTYGGMPYGGSGGSVRPMNRVRAYLEFSGVCENIFVGYAESWNASWPGGGLDAITTLQAADEAKVLNLASLPSSGSTSSSANVSPHLRAILDALNNHAPRNIQDGADSSTSFTISFTGQAGWPQLVSIARSDFDLDTNVIDANLFISKNGVVTFLNANYRAVPPYTTVRVLYGDGGGSERPYLDLTTDYSDSFLHNTWTVQGATLSGSSSDATSIGSYGVRANNRSVVWDSSTSAASMAAVLVNKYKDPMQRETSLSPKMADPDTCLETIQLDLLDRIEVKRRPPGGGSPIDQQVFVQAIHWALTPGTPPSIALGLSPL